MGVLINGINYAKPLINGVPHNLLINGQKIFASGGGDEEIVKVASSDIVWSTTAFVANTLSNFYDGNLATVALLDSMGEQAWLTLDFGEGGKRINNVLIKKWFINNAVKSGYVILSNTKPMANVIPSDSIILRQGNPRGLIENTDLDSPDKINRYRYLSFSEQYNGDESYFYEMEVYEIAETRSLFE